MPKRMSSLFICLNLFIGFVNAQAITRLDHSTVTFKQIDERVETLMKVASVHGMEIAIFNNNTPVYKKAFGYKRLDTKQPLKTNTNIYGASLSKAVFAVLVMKLVEEGRLDLDKPLQSYLPKRIYEYPTQTKWHDHYEDLKNDSSYKKITARMCLDHTTGLPNWRWFEPDQKLRIKFPPGSKYSYSGEGLVYLQVVIERSLGTTLEKLAQEKIFGPLKMNMSSYAWQPKFENDYSVGHNANGQVYDKDKDNEPRSASTLETTLDDYTSFVKSILEKKILKPSSIKEMFRPQIRIRSVQQFGLNSQRDSSANDAINLSYGLGWGLFQSPYGIAAFKEGHGDGFQHYVIVFPDQGTGILIMSNSDNAESIFKDLLDFTIADRQTPWYWEDYIPYYMRGK